MKRKGRVASILGSSREMCRIVAEVVVSGGVYWPFSRKDLMFDMRRREEAEGESKMMGSGRREAFLGRETRLAVWVGMPAAVAAVVVGAPGRGRERERKTSADLRTWEKS